jgi:hypothetical protein
VTYHVSYKGDNSGRRAVNDWVQWLGMKRSKMLARVARGTSTDPDLPCSTPTERWNTFNLCCGFAGVSGQPVREAFKHFAKITQEELEAIPD